MESNTNLDAIKVTAVRDDEHVRRIIAILRLCDTGISISTINSFIKEHMRWDCEFGKSHLGKAIVTTYRRREHRDRIMTKFSANDSQLSQQ